MPPADLHQDLRAGVRAPGQKYHRYAEANMARRLAADAEDDDIERTFRETRPDRVAPFSTHVILADRGEHGLGLPRSS